MMIGITMRRSFTKNRSDAAQSLRYESFDDSMIIIDRLPGNNEHNDRFARRRSFSPIKSDIIVPLRKRDSLNMSGGTMQKKKKKVHIARIDGWNERTNERERRNIGSWPLSGLCLRLVRGTVVMRPCRRIRMVEIDRYRDWMEHRVWPCVPHEIQMRP